MYGAVGKSVKELQATMGRKRGAFKASGEVMVVYKFVIGLARQK
jgi:hypothetical protein